MIGGFEEPTEGAIFLGDTDIVGLPPYKRDVNTVFQSYALFPHLTIRDNVAFGLERKGDGRGAQEAVVEMPRARRPGGLGKRKPKQLSGGQQQRVALARALVNRPHVLLLDEPLGALDLKLRKQMQLELKRIQTEVGITFVHVTHDQEEAMTMADTIAVMQGGRIEQLGTPIELYERPRTAFVAGFLGTSNLLTGTVEAGAVRLDDGTVVRADMDGATAGLGRRPAREGATRGAGDNSSQARSARPPTSASRPRSSWKRRRRRHGLPPEHGDGRARPGRRLAGHRFAGVRIARSSSIREGKRDDLRPG